MQYLGPVMIDIEGVELTPQDRSLLKNPLTGGVILFTRNFESEKQVKKLIQDIKAIRDPALLIAIDHEGGRVQRFKKPFTVIPALNALGIKYNTDPTAALHDAEIFGWLTAIELLAFDVDFSFTPVLDIDYGLSAVIGNRAFHNNANIIVEIAAAYIKGMHRAGMPSTGKHFPGHGGVSADSHIDIPIDTREIVELLESDIVPFEKLSNSHLDGIMPAHVIYEKINKDPAGFSSYWLKDILRDKLKFDGVIFSDDLDMEGASFISDNYTVRAETALAAGCDMVLVCNNRNAAIEVLDNLKYSVTKESHAHLMTMRGESNTRISNKKHLSWDALTQTQDWKKAVKVVSLYKEN